MEPAIEIRGLSKKFRVWQERPSKIKGFLVASMSGKPALGRVREFWALDGVDCTIYPGEFVGIMGRNGAGKSTLFKILSGIYEATSGQVQVRGTILPLIELGAGFQPELSGLENIFLNASILGFGRKATLKALPRIVEFAELGDNLHMPVKHYSSGMLVRLGFAIASHLSGDILLIDEVLAVGDVAFQQRCLERIRSLNREGRTIVLVTHNPSTVREECNRCIVIENQKKYFDGPAHEGVDAYLQLMGTA